LTKTYYISYSTKNLVVCYLLFYVVSILDSSSSSSICQSIDYFIRSIFSQETNRTIIIILLLLRLFLIKPNNSIDFFFFFLLYSLRSTKYLYIYKNTIQLKHKLSRARAQKFKPNLKEVYYFPFFLPISYNNKNCHIQRDLYNF
jgi:hypothetical protein